MELFVTGLLHSFETDNNKRCMSCSCIGIGLVTGMLYVLVRILEVIGHGNIIHFCYYNKIRSRGSRINMNGISNVIRFLFSFWYMLRNIKTRCTGVVRTLLLTLNFNGI